MAISLIAHHEYQHFGVIDKRNDLQLEPEQIEGFEADAIAPPPPERTHPKKVASSKNKKKRLKKKQNLQQNMHDQEQSQGKIQSDDKDSEETPEKEKPAVNAHIWGT